MSAPPLDPAEISPARPPLRGAGDLWRDATGAVRAAVVAQADSWFLWSPVAAGGGAAVYIGMKSEPSLALALGIVGAAILAAVIARRLAFSRLAVILTCLVAFAACGFAAAKLRTLSVAAPVAPETGAVPITGWVVDVATPGESGGRLLIAPASIGGLTASELPRRIRVTADQDLFGPGTAIRFTGLLNPPPAPASPAATTMPAIPGSTASAALARR